MSAKFLIILPILLFASALTEISTNDSSSSASSEVVSSTESSETVCLESLEKKKTNFRSQLKKSNTNLKTFSMLVSRSNVFNESHRIIANSKARELTSKEFKVTFKGEPIENEIKKDLVKEWFCIMSINMSKRCFPNYETFSFDLPEKICKETEFRFLGRVTAMALYYDQLVQSVFFNEKIFDAILGKPFKDNYWGTKEQIQKIDAFRKGFHSIIPLKLIKQFNRKELSLLLNGIPITSIEQLDKIVTFKGYSETDDVIKYFWKMVKTFEKNMWMKLLWFLTGVPRIPVFGVSVSIVPTRDPFQRLPVANTKTGELVLPHYTTYGDFVSGFISTIAVNEKNLMGDKWGPGKPKKSSEEEDNVQIFSIFGESFYYDIDF